ncbi:MAG: glycosyltransferase [Verrucomicrobiia bacterium]
MHAIQCILFVTDQYPSPAFPSRGTFVHQLVSAVADQGVRCVVIHPCKWHELRQERRAVCAHPAADPIRVIRPRWLSLSNRRLAHWNSYSLTHRFFESAVRKSVSKLPSVPNAFYGHFLYPAGATAVSLGRLYGRPSFAAVGESIESIGEVLWTVRPVGLERSRIDFGDVRGILAVSAMLQRWLIQRLLIPMEKTAVFPNAVDHKRFYPRNKVEMRKKYGLPLEQFIVIFVGAFKPHKGPLRLAAAIDGLQQIVGVFVGSGPCVPEASNVAFCGRVEHGAVPELLSAADCFVLPSTAEGCSNATIEAMACGVPVVVADSEFNDELVDAECGMRVEVGSVEALRGAILKLQRDEVLRASMAKAALARASNLSIAQRAVGVLEWMDARFRGAEVQSDNI